MDGSRFDHLTRSLASGASRRSIIKGLLGLGGAAVTGGTLLDDADAARRPTPTPTPVRCPGIQIPSGGQCVCPNGLAKCGPDCCNPTAVGASHSECCDNACCFGTCYGEELCCPTETGEICGDDCCDTATERCCERPGGPVCIPFDACCLDRECPGDATQCQRGVCNPQTNSCELQSECTGDERCCPDQQPGDVGVCLGPDDCCAAIDCTNPPRDMVCPVASCVDNACHYEEMCNEGTFCCAGELCCPSGPGSGCCTLPDGSHKCTPECCDDSNCKNFEPGTCVRPRCDADGFCQYDELCENDQFCCADEICCGPGGGCCSAPDGTHRCVPECCDDSNCKNFEPGTCVRPRCDPEGFCHYDDLCGIDQFCCADEICCASGGGCCTNDDGTHRCVPECCDASNCKNAPDDCSTPVCSDEGICEYIGCPPGQVCLPPPVPNTPGTCVTPD